VKKIKGFVVFFLFFVACACAQVTKPAGQPIPIRVALKTGAERMGEYLPKLQGKKVAMMVNQTSMVGKSHLVDTLLTQKINIVRIFAPEHGFRGDADAGEKIVDGKDAKTGISIVSLYGSKLKPSAEDLAGVDVLIFDIQDVGTRFYTYISSLHYLMDAAAENKVPLLILDRPNPNGHYVDGPVLDPAFRSFVGMDKVPIVHGLTVGEYAQMLNGEDWLEAGRKCDLQVVICLGYNHNTPYILPVKPSPNLPNARSVLLYPSLCFFEGTVVSVGRGTDKQFQVMGAPKSKAGDYTFTPVSKPGAKDPPHKGVQCRGFDLTKFAVETVRKQSRIRLDFLIDFYKSYPEEEKEKFFNANKFIDKLAGTDQLRKQILAGKTEKEIRDSWEPGLSQYKEMRKKYLLYP
jgi:uncharacterized protein YbbC (DUF1343 family)